ncbi:dihydrolipoamide acetyltransferase family protein [soil metagenome]
MATAANIEVTMPQMGESITEATITKWRKNAGETIEEGEPLLDISTAKVEVEIPAPASGILAATLFNVGDIVPIETVIAVIAPPGTDAASINASEIKRKAQPKPETPVPTEPKPIALSYNDDHHKMKGMTQPDKLEDDRSHLIKRRSTPLVRNIAQDLGIDLSGVAGTGIHGRVTKKDIESFIAEQKKMQNIQGTLPSLPVKIENNQPPARLRPGSVRMDTVSGPYQAMAQLASDNVPVSMMRRAIAENLTRSAQEIPHAYTVHEVDFSHLERVRVRYKPIFDQQFSTRLTPLVFLVSAVSDALLKFPSINASWAGDHILKHKHVSIGIAVAVREGLVVPVLKNVETMSLAGIARGLVDLATRARANQLKPGDMEGGTFSITSPGQLGAAFAIPIILPPQGAIIHMGAIQKTPTVVTGPDGEDSIAIRQRAMITLGIDHRLIDGWEADQFMVTIKERIQRADFGLPS